MDINRHSFSDANQPPDALPDRLRQEALVERPTFSPDLHDRILKHIHHRVNADEVHRSLRTRRLFRFAAAVAILAVLLAVSWKARSRRISIPTPPNDIVKNDRVRPMNPLKPTPGTLEFRVAGVVSADLLPPRIEFQLPSLDLSSHVDSPQSVDATSNGLPERLLSSLRNPALSASESLTDVVPPNFRLLLPLVRPAIARANEPVN